MNDIKNNIIHKIKAGEVQMVPRWQFVLKALLLALSVIIVGMLSVYCLSFVLFALHETGVWFAPGFGLAGLLFFLMASPWMLISLVGVFLLVLYFLVTRYSFSYRKPLVYSLIGVVLFVTAVSSFIQYTAMHARINAFAERHEVPGLAPLYRGLAKDRPGSLVVGTLVSVDQAKVEVVTDQGVVVEIALSTRTKLPPHKPLVVGDVVMVFGRFEGDDLVAFGVRYVSDEPPQGKYLPLGEQARGGFR